MPLLRIDVVEGRSDSELKELLDAVHRALVDAFKVPERDRFQIVHEHPASRMVVEDVGLNIERTKDLMVVHVTTRAKPPEQKVEFYRRLCEELNRSCGIAASDVVVSVTENGDADWSFGEGRAQFVTGEL